VAYSTPQTVFELVLDFLENFMTEVGKNIRQAFTLWWRRISEALDRASRPPTLNPLEIAARIGNLIQFIAVLTELLLNDLSSVVAQSLISSLLAFVIPGPLILNQSVMTRKDAFEQFCDFLLSTGYDVVSLHIPLEFKWALILKGLIADGRRIVDKTQPWFVKLLKRLVGSAWKSFWIAVANTGLFLFQYVGLFYILLLFVYFLEYVARGLVLKPLSQSAPRKRVETEAGFIYRREPGGSPP
jgi:hypothetical protein